MGNNSAFSNFEDVVLAVYNKGVLDLDLLKDLAKCFEDQDADSGGYSGTPADDGKDLLDIVILLSGKDAPKRPDLPEKFSDWTPEQDEENERYQEAVWAIFDEICQL